MKTLFALLVGLCVSGSAQAQTTLRTPAELDALCAPIALYPDELLAVMLPAATTPADIVLAARFHQTGGDIAQVDGQAWDNSVKVLAHYPELAKWMADNLEWTKAMGLAFRDQPSEVMAAIQRLRVRAEALGNLKDTPLQRIVADGSVLRILPQNTEVIYMPAYDPLQVYSMMPWPDNSWITFSFGWQIGRWPHYDFDWRRHQICVRERHTKRREPIEAQHPWRPPMVTSHSAPTPQSSTRIVTPATPTPTATVVTTIQTPAAIQWNHEPRQHTAAGLRRTEPTTAAPQNIRRGMVAPHPIQEHAMHFNVSSGHATHNSAPPVAPQFTMSQSMRVTRSTPNTSQPAPRSMPHFESRVTHSAPPATANTTPSNNHSQGDGGHWGHVATRAGP